MVCKAAYRVVVYGDTFSTVGEMGVGGLDLASNTSIRIVNSSLIAFISSIIYVSIVELFTRASSSPVSS